jgi:predicted lipid-binding transport protein (Tim44 family)
MLFKKVASVLLIVSLTLPALVEARAGSTSHGGYGGSRGSFGGGSGYHGQSYQGGGYNYNPQPAYRAPYAPQAGYANKRSSGGFFSGLFSGILGTYIYNKVLNPSHPAAATTTPAGSNQVQGSNNPQATTTTTTATTAAPPQFSFFRILLLAALAYFIWRMVTRRRRKNDSQDQQQSFSNQAPPAANPQKMNLRDFFNVLGGTGAAGAATQQGQGQGQVAVSSQDSQTFENLLLSIQDAWTHNNLPALSRLTTPDMYNNFVNIMRENQQQNLSNSISHVKLLNQAVQDTWQDGTATFARVAMTWSAIDYMVNTALSPSDPGYLVEGNVSEPSTVTELWTFRKDPQNPWVLSDIQQP